MNSQAACQSRMPSVVSQSRRAAIGWRTLSALLQEYIKTLVSNAVMQLVTGGHGARIREL